MKAKVATTTAIATPTPSACRHVNLLRLAVVCASSVPSAVISGPGDCARSGTILRGSLSEETWPAGSPRCSRFSPWRVAISATGRPAARRDAERRGDRRACADSGAAAPIALRARRSGDPLVRGEAHRLPAQRQNMDHLPRRDTVHTRRLDTEEIERAAWEHADRCNILIGIE